MAKRAGCIIVHDGKLLILHHLASGYWGFPKGKIEQKETPEDAAIREVMEESGIKISREQLGRCFRCGDSKYYFVVLDENPSVILDYSEVDSFMWIDLSTHLTLPTSIVTRKIMRKIKVHSQI